MNRNRFTYLLLVISLVVSAFIFTPVSRSSSLGYSVKSPKNPVLRVVKNRGWSIYRRPGFLDAKAVLNTRKIKGQVVKIKRVAVRGPQRYDLIVHKGHTYGWLDNRDLTKPSTYVLPYTYNSQLYPLWAPEACEAASLKTALSVKGLDSGIGLKYIVDHMPQSSNSNRGFSGDPYKDNTGIFYWWNLIKHGFNSITGETIYPKPLTHYAQKYDPGARNITGASKAKLISEIKHGNPVIFVGTFQMRNDPHSYHVLTLVGYRRGQFLITDPYRYLGQSHRVFWISTKKFMKIFSNQIRKRRAVAI